MLLGTSRTSVYEIQERVKIVLCEIGEGVLKGFAAFFCNFAHGKVFRRYGHWQEAGWKGRYTHTYNDAA